MAPAVLRWSIPASTVPRSKNRLLATALRRKHYAIEGSIFIAGAVVQWLRDELGVIASAPESEALAQARQAGGRALFRACFYRPGRALLGSQARGAILGLTRDVGKAEIVRAALDAVCYQTRDFWRRCAATWRRRVSSGCAR